MKAYGLIIGVLLGFCGQAFAQVSSKKATPPPAIETTQGFSTSNKELRKRTHNLTIEYSAVDAEFEIKSPVNTDFEGEKTSLSIAYGYELGHFTIWGNLATSHIKATDSKVNLIGVSVHINAIKNEPGNDLIPYVMLGLGRYDEDFELGGDDLSAEGNATSFGFGVKWYPFGELFAFNFSFERFMGDLDISGNTLANDVAADLTMQGFNLGYILSF